MDVHSGIGSADFQLPFPLSNHETSSSEWLPRPVMAPFECLTLAFVQWNYGGKCLAANSGMAIFSFVLAAGVLTGLQTTQRR